MVDNWVYVDTALLRKIAYTMPSSLTHLMHTTGYCTIWSFTSQWTPINTKYFLRHHGRGGRQLHICKLWHVHHIGVIN